MCEKCHENPFDRVRPSRRNLLLVVSFGLICAGLTILTVGVAFIDIQQEWIKVLLALTIASIKATFVALFFMHLKFESKLIYFILIVPLTFTVVLICALIPDIVMPALHHLMLGRPY